MVITWWPSYYLQWPSYYLWWPSYYLRWPSHYLRWPSYYLRWPSHYLQWSSYIHPKLQYCMDTHPKRWHHCMDTHLAPIPQNKETETKVTTETNRTLRPYMNNCNPATLANLLGNLGHFPCWVVVSFLHYKNKFQNKDKMAAMLMLHPPRSPVPE